MPPASAPSPGSPAPRQLTSTPDTHHCCTSFSVTARENSRKEKKRFSAFPVTAGVLLFTEVTALRGMPQGSLTPGTAVSYPHASGCLRGAARGSSTSPGGAAGTGVPPAAELRSPPRRFARGMHCCKMLRTMQGLGWLMPGEDPALPSCLPRAKTLLETSDKTSAWRRCGEGICPAPMSAHCMWAWVQPTWVSVPPGTSCLSEPLRETSSDPPQGPGNLYQAPEKPKRLDKLENEHWQPQVSRAWG